MPGIFGFLVWEFRENWRLYAANRPKGLRPVPLGPHGETMPRLLRPGFHSGTLPKRFAKLRRAERRAGKWPWLLPFLTKTRLAPPPSRGPAADRAGATAVRPAGIRRAFSRKPPLASPPAGERPDSPGHEPRADRHVALLSAGEAPASGYPGVRGRESLGQSSSRITIETTGGWVLADAAGGQSTAGLSPAAPRILETALGPLQDRRGGFGAGPNPGRPRTRGLRL